MSKRGGSPYKGERHRKTLRIPVKLYKRLQKIAKHEDDNLNDLIVHYLEQATESKTGTKFSAAA